MSAEHHGGHGGEGVTEIIQTLFLFLVIIPAVTKPVEDAVQEIVAPDVAGGHGGHH